MCGTLMFGLLGDRIGRVKAVILANWCGFLGDFSTIFTGSLTAFSVTRFVSGLAADANSYLMYILRKYCNCPLDITDCQLAAQLTELISNSHRVCLAVFAQRGPEHGDGDLLLAGLDRSRLAGCAGGQLAAVSGLLLAAAAPRHTLLFPGAGKCPVAGNT